MCPCKKLSLTGSAHTSNVIILWYIPRLGIKLDVAEKALQSSLIQPEGCRMLWAGQRPQSVLAIQGSCLPLTSDATAAEAML